MAPLEIDPDLPLNVSRHGADLLLYLCIFVLLVLELIRRSISLKLMHGLCKGLRKSLQRLSLQNWCQNKKKST